MAVHSVSPAGGSPRRARTFSIPASRIRSSIARSSPTVALTHVKWAIASSPCWALIERTMSTVLRFWSLVPPAP